MASAMGLRESPRPGAGASPLGLRFDLSHAIWQDRRGGRGRKTAVPTRKEPNIAKKPNLIVILIDDLRFDETSASGHPYMKTPHIDRLAREGAMFENAFHTTPLCSIKAWPRCTTWRGTPTSSGISLSIPLARRCVRR